MNDSMVIALDFGTSSVRAILFDARGREFIPLAKDGEKQATVIEAQVKYAQNTSSDGGVEVDAEELFGYSVQCIRQVLRKAGPLRKRIAGVGISCFWHSLVGVDESGHAVTPLISWADTRSAGHAIALKQKFDASEYHARTGCELHPSFWPAKILWLRETQPEKARRVHCWMGFGEYALQRLFGKTMSSLSMASGTGLFNQAKAYWDDATLDALQIGRDQLPALTDCDAPLSGPVDAFRNDLGVLADVPWYPALGDGACSNVGSGAVDETRLALNIGTSAAMRVVVPAGDSVEIEPGLFCYRVDCNNVLFGGAFANGGNVHAWMRNTFEWKDDKAFAKQVGQISPDGHGLTVLPFWAGERSPGWHGDARATITGMNLHTTPADIVRASLEACAYSFDVVRDRLQARFPSAKELVVSGGALEHDPVWAQILADVFGTTIVTSKVAEASSRGAALLALRSLGVLKRLEDAHFAKGKTFKPDMRKHEIYQNACSRYRELYQKMLRD
jgi:gluconokinase